MIYVKLTIFRQFFVRISIDMAAKFFVSAYRWTRRRTCHRSQRKDTVLGSAWIRGGEPGPIFLWNASSKSCIAGPQTATTKQSIWATMTGRIWAYFRPHWLLFRPWSSGEEIVHSQFLTWQFRYPLNTSKFLVHVFWKMFLDMLSVSINTVMLSRIRKYCTRADHPHGLGHTSLRIEMMSGTSSNCQGRDYHISKESCSSG